MMVRAGVGLADITPPAGLAMTGFGARTLPAEGAHDRLTARALVIGETAIVVADVLGIDADMSERIRARSGLPPEAVVVAAVHNHGGPVSMPERLGAKADADYLRMLEDGCVKAISRARQTAVEAELYFGYGEDPGIARNRRRADGPVDRALPVLAVRDRAGETIAVLVSYACHPVVLDATNLLWTADYPHFVRAGIEAAFPGATALFLTGCAGDINTGHSAHASLSLEQNAARSFDAANAIGKAIANCVLAASLQPIAGNGTGYGEAFASLHFERRETEPLEDLARAWDEEAKTAPAVGQAVLPIWARWARRFAADRLDPLRARTSALCWGEVGLVALPGEVFSQTSLDLRAAMGMDGFVICYAGDNPGYIPPASEYAHGGYEIDEAHRYYGMPATFAKGSAEALSDAALRALGRAGTQKSAT